MTIGAEALGTVAIGGLSVAAEEPAAEVITRIDYYAIEEAIKAVLDGDATLSSAGVLVLIEEQIIFDVEARGGWVVIYAERRDPSNESGISAGQRQRYAIRFSLWCWAYSLEGTKDAMERRDDLVGNVEVALLGNRSLSGAVHKTILGGGDLAGGPLPQDMGGFVAGAEIILTAEATARTE